MNGKATSYLALEECIELSLIYDPSNYLSPFTITDTPDHQRRRNKGHSLISLSRIIRESLSLENTDETTKNLIRIQNEKFQMWSEVKLTLQEAKARLNNFTFKLSVNKKQPTYGDITFVHTDLSKIESLKNYV